MVGMKVVPIRTMKVKRPFRRQRYTFGARIKIMWEEQLVDPPIDYIVEVSVVVTATDVGLPAEFALVWSDEDMLEIAWGIT